MLCHLLSSSGFHLLSVPGTYQPYFYFHWLILLPKTLFHRGILPNSFIILIFCWLNLSPTPSPCLLCLIFTILISTAVHTSILHIFHLYLPFFPLLRTYLEKEMASHSSTSTWKIPRMEEPCMLSPWCHKESDTTEQLHFLFQTYYLLHIYLLLLFIVTLFENVNSMKPGIFMYYLH